MRKDRLDIYMQSYFNYLETLKHSIECEAKNNSDAQCSCHYSISADMHRLLLEARAGRGVEAAREFDSKYPWLQDFNY